MFGDIVRHCERYV